MSKYALCKGVSVEYVDGNMVLLKDNGDAATLNNTAKNMVEKVLEEEFKDVLDNLKNEYEIEHNVVETDLNELIEEMCEKELIELKN